MGMGVQSTRKPSSCNRTKLNRWIVDAAKEKGLRHGRVEIGEPKAKTKFLVDIRRRKSIRFSVER